jgi:glutathione synthase/RimK-type ligase-like ATP-grasp enzyme
MKAGSFFPGTHYSSLYAMAGDDCSLHFDLNELTEKQQADHESNIELTAMLQVALSCIGHKEDHLGLYDEFLKPEWYKTLERYHGFFSSMVAEVVPMDHFSYHPKYTFYESVAKHIDEHPQQTDVANLYMSSGSNAVIHNNPALLEINRNVNSKKHFAENAPEHDIPVPDTLVSNKGELGDSHVQDFFDRHNNQIVAKLLGLAGARNVTIVDSVDACREFVAEYDEDMILLLQQRLPLDHYTEMTVDLVVSDKHIQIANTRRILFAEGLWVGNLIGESVSLTDEQIAVLIKVGEYARNHGYSSTEGSNCGVDFFIGNDGSIIVTEINARWTGGLFPAEILKKLGTSRDAVPFFDVVRIDKREAYIEFLAQHLAGQFEGEFAMVPIGFGPYPVPMEDGLYFYTWQMVLGDLEVFKKVKSNLLGEGVLPTAEIISLK